MEENKIKPLPPLRHVKCSDCFNFTKDDIGDGGGIGSCAHGIIWTQQIPGRMPLYPHAKRNCNKYNIEPKGLLAHKPIIDEILSKHSVYALLQCFFKSSEDINIDLLKDDKIWLMKISQGHSLDDIRRCIGEYITTWHKVMNTEDGRQNAGRFAANSYIREALEGIKPNQQVSISANKQQQA